MEFLGLKISWAFLLYVTLFWKTDHVVTFSISRNMDFKYRIVENIGEFGESTDNLPKFYPSKFYNDVTLNIDARDRSRRTENGWYFELFQVQT